MKTLRLSVLAAFLLGGCDYDVPDLNRPGIESLQHPTPSAVNAVATGLLIGARTGINDRVGTVVEWGILGREALVLTPSDPRFVSELLQSPNLDPGSNNFGGNFWVIPYANIRAANLLLHALDNSELVGFSAAQKEATRGFAKTIQALDYLQVVNAHYTNGAVLDTDLPLGQSGQLVTDLDVIYGFIEARLDDAKTRLTAAGAVAFPFPVGSGFAAFDNPAKFLKFNRALRARVAVYHAKYADALAALSESFLDDTTPLKANLGVYHAFGAGSGDLPNVLNGTDILAHPSIVTDAEKQSGGGTDFRINPEVGTSKIRGLAAAVTLSNHSSQYAFTRYPNSDSPIPIIRNEELVLLRAEANIGLGRLNASGGAPAGGALQDINLIRTQSGGLAARAAFATHDEALDELLRQKRFSLLFEGGHRWIDLRRYGKLDAAHVAVDVPQDVIHRAFPIPLTELVNQ